MPQGWSHGFSDYPVGEEGFYKLKADYRPLPASYFGGAGSCLPPRFGTNVQYPLSMRFTPWQHVEVPPLQLHQTRAWHRDCSAAEGVIPWGHHKFRGPFISGGDR